MNQKKIGQFIAELRKERGFTQKALADNLGITDKAVSKWECGNGLPDSSIMVELCNILEISVNELLCGERLSSVDYNRKAEENMMSLIEERNEQEKKGRKHIVSGIFGELLLFVVLLWLYSYSVNNEIRLNFFIDFGALLLEIGTVVFMLLTAKKVRALRSLFRLAFQKSENELLRKEAKEAGSFTIKAILLAGGINFIIYLISWLRVLNDMSLWGPNLSVMILSVFYSLIIAAVLLVLKERV